MRVLLLVAIIACRPTDDGKRASPPEPVSGRAATVAAPLDAASTDGSVAAPEYEVVRITGGAPCDIGTLAELAIVSWRQASHHRHLVGLADQASGRASVKATETLEPKVGTCTIHAIDARASRYEVRDHARVIGVPTATGLILRAPVYNVDDTTVGDTGRDLLARHPAPAFRPTCRGSEHGVACVFERAGSPLRPRVVYYVDGTVDAELTGSSAAAVLERATVRGIQVL